MRNAGYFARVGSDGDDGGSNVDRHYRERLAKLGEIAIEIAHELRNVLQVISSSAYVARHETTRGDARAALPHVLKIEKSARTAHGIVDDLMALARGDLQFESILLADVLVAVRAELTPGGGPGRVAWDDALDPPDQRVLAHAGLLVRLFHTLYENAIQASAPAAPRIATRARAAAGRVIIDVTDDGPGVPADVAARVFEPLVTARAGGTGVGLALARRIADALGGSIALVEDASPGATFRIELAGVR